MLSTGGCADGVVSLMEYSRPPEEYDNDESINTFSAGLYPEMTKNI